MLSWYTRRTLPGPTGVGNAEPPAREDVVDGLFDPGPSDELVHAATTSETTMLSATEIFLMHLNLPPSTYFGRPWLS
jgi:hypothetical protein